MELEAKQLSELILKLDSEFGLKLQAELKRRGFNVGGKIISKSLILLNHRNTRFIKDKDLNSGDLIQISPFTLGG